MGGVLLALTTMPIREATVPALTALVFAGNLAATFVAFATEGLMAHNAGRGGVGRASGWFQSGNQFGQTAGGGLGLWLTQHVPAPWMAGAALCAVLVVMLAGARRAWRNRPVHTRRARRRRPGPRRLARAERRCSPRTADGLACCSPRCRSAPGRRSFSSDRSALSGTCRPTSSR